jgi:uncharacterized protein YbjT (DUF2867 family)
MILVTGATGNVGHNVVAQLLEQGQAVRAMTRDPGRAHFPEGVEVVAGDLSRAESLPAAVYGVQRAFLFPVHGQLRTFVDLADGYGLERIVLLSSSTVTTRPLNSIGQAHADSEETVAAGRVPWTFVRPGAFMTNDLRWAPQIKAESVVRAPYGAATSAPIDERDIAAVAVAALLGDGHAGRDYVLTGPESLSQAERVKLLGEALGREVRFEEQTPEEYREAMADRPPQVVETLLGLLARQVGATAEVRPTVAEVTGRPAFTYRQWAEHHRADF